MPIYRAGRAAPSRYASHRLAAAGILPECLIFRDTGCRCRVLATSNFIVAVAAALPFASPIPQCGIFSMSLILSVFCATPASEFAQRLRSPCAEIVVALLPFGAVARDLNTTRRS
jgi:hypothetical protein